MKWNGSRHFAVAQVVLALDHSTARQEETLPLLALLPVDIVETIVGMRQPSRLYF